MKRFNMHLISLPKITVFIPAEGLTNISMTTNILVATALALFFLSHLRAIGAGVM